MYLFGWLIIMLCFFGFRGWSGGGIIGWRRDWFVKRDLGRRVNNRIMIYLMG